MSIIFVLIPLAVIIVAIAIGVFFWAVKSNQFDDLERQGYSILFDDDVDNTEGQTKKGQKNSQLGSPLSEQIDDSVSSKKDNNR